VTVDGAAMAASDGSSIMGLTPGARVSMRTLLYGLLLPSGNDAAEQLARSVAESRDQFVSWMNSMASDDLRLADTHFVNPSGLDAADHYASAYDLAQLARRAMRDDVFRDMVATPTIRSDGFVLSGHNPLIGAYPGADGVKTGTTDAAGKAIVGSASRNGHRVFVVVMHSDDLLADSSALFDWAWQSFSWN
jgi:D-alanyl-D-alanine carboxypeptidase